MYDTKETKETDFIFKMEKYKVFLTKFVDILIVYGLIRAKIKRPSDRKFGEKNVLLIYKEVITFFREIHHSLHLLT